jgi:23S rRNA pseudouridine2605 synthase
VETSVDERIQDMQERLQKIIARAGIASRRHAELLITSGQVRVNGKVVTELGSKADAAKDRIEAAGKVVEANERRVYLLLNKPAEVMCTLADPEGRKTLKNLLRGFPERVYPVGSLEYATAGLVFLTNDGDLAAGMLRNWENLEQAYHVKVKGILTIADLERIGKEVGVRMKTVRQPGATRGKARHGGQARRGVQAHGGGQAHGGQAGNFWYEVTMRDSKVEALRNAMFRERHPVEKLMRIGLGTLSLEGIPRGRYRMLEKNEVEELKKKQRGKEAAK